MDQAWFPTSDELRSLVSQASFFGVVAQLCAAAITFAFFALLLRQSPRRSYLRLWTWSHALLALALLAVLARYLTLTTRDPFAYPAERSLYGKSLHAAYQVAKLGSLACLSMGVWSFARGRLPRALVPLAAAFALVYGVATAIVGLDLPSVVIYQAPIAVVCYAASAWALLWVARARAALGTRISGWLFALLALVWIGYGVWMRPRGEASAPTLEQPSTLLIAYNSQIDLVLGLLLAFGLALVLQQDLQREALARRDDHDALARRLVQAQRLEAVGGLVSGVAHELSTPLTSILGYTKQLIDDDPAGAHASKLRVVHDQATRCKTIVRNLLTFVGSREERWEDIELRALAARVLSGLQAETQALGVTVALAPGAALSLRGDPAGLEQVLTNLVQNAAQATGASGNVRVYVRRVADDAELCVEDDGPGLTSDVLARVFEPFFTTKAPGKGSGLGLSVSHGIVRGHGGTLQAENLPRPARGARFSARIPLHSSGPAAATPWPRVSSRTGAPSWPPSHRPPSQREFPPARPMPTAEPVAHEPLPVRELLPQPPPPTRREAALNGPHVCVIEDDAPVRQLLRSIFERDGWRVDVFEDGRAGLTRLLEYDAYDAIVSDVRMQNLSGTGLYESLTRERPDLISRLVLITGDMWSPELEVLRRRGDCVILHKPLDFEQLLRHCRQRAATKQARP